MNNQMRRCKRCIQKEVESPHLILIMRNQVDNNPDQKVTSIQTHQTRTPSKNSTSTQYLSSAHKLKTTPTTKYRNNSYFQWDKL